MTPHVIAPADLLALATALARRFPDEPDGPAHLVHLACPAGPPAGRLADDDEVDLGVAALDPGAHPLEALACADAPPDWFALGVVTLGTVRHSHDPTVVGARVRSAHLVERGGGWASSCTPIDGSPLAVTDACGTAADAPVGRVDDGLRRALGLPTAPPATDTLELFTVQWLDRLAAEAARLDPSGRSRCTPAWAASHHPAVDALGLAADDLDPARLVAEGWRLATWRDWPQLRRTCAAGAWEHPAISPALADWLDDGAFSRWALDAWPDLPSLVELLVALLPPATARLVLDSVVAWDLCALQPMGDLVIP